ncbi:MAG: hemerythrin [Rhodocyclaceae bacterium]|nr:MAG: hemerythrin [Rhodocyclaceae bacterium]
MISHDEETFVWSDRYVLGYSPMDHHHKEFVSLVGEMLNSWPLQLAPLLERFLIHAKAHFEDEAKWMTDTQFPGMECHIDEHNAVINSCMGVMKRIEDGDFSAGYLLASELSSWFPAHADYLDSALAQWMVKRSNGGVPIVFKRNSGRYPQD